MRNIEIISDKQDVNAHAKQHYCSRLKRFNESIKKKKKIFFVFCRIHFAERQVFGFVGRMKDISGSDVAKKPCLAFRPD